MNVVSFSLFGENPKYTIGMLKNIELVHFIYPGWKCFIFTDYSSDDHMLRQYRKCKDVTIISVRGIEIPGTLWRFLPSQVDKRISRFIVRDADSRINVRESLAVAEWVTAGTTMHIMRDHPHHTARVMAGMWGMKNDSDFDILTALTNFKNSRTELSNGSDQDFLASEIYPRFVHSSTIHATWNRMENHAKSFPCGEPKGYFVGEIFDFAEMRPYLDRDAGLLAQTSKRV
jgi:hypothetical protein